MQMYRIVETDNFDGDYPDEKFVNVPPCSSGQAIEIANLLNEVFCNHPHSPRFWKVVSENYRLVPGFES